RGRQNANMRSPELHRITEYVADQGQAVVGYLPSMPSILGDIAAVELVKFLTRILPSSTVGSVVEVNLLAVRVDARTVLKLPRCAVCSSLNERSSVSLDRRDFVEASECGE